MRPHEGDQPRRARSALLYRHCRSGSPAALDPVPFFPDGLPLVGIRADAIDPAGIRVLSRGTGAKGQWRMQLVNDRSPSRPGARPGQGIRTIMPPDFDQGTAACVPSNAEAARVHDCWLREIRPWRNRQESFRIRIPDHISARQAFWRGMFDLLPGSQ